jgi:hypothetical protein
MNRTGVTRHLRALGATLFLALFLAGTHLCLIRSVGASLGAHFPVSCDATGATAKAGSHCGHCSPSRAPDTASESPCCIALLPSAMPTASDAGDATSPVALVAAPGVDVAPLVIVTRCASGPPPIHPGDPALAPLAPRAPPLL